MYWGGSGNAINLLFS